MNYPKNARTVPAVSGGTAPSVLRNESLRYHEAAWGLDKPVVMAEMPLVTSVHNPGENDSIRDGYSAPKIEWRRVYASLEDWLDAGNEDPRK